MDKYIGSIKRFINKNINKQNTKDFLLNHKNTLIVIVAIILLGGITTIISYAYFTIVANQSIVGGQVGSIANINMYYFVEDKNASTGAGLGTYSKSVYVPRTTYTYNSSLSYCKHGSTLSYNASTYTFTVSKTKDACYAYFDVSESKNADIIIDIYQQKNGEYKKINDIPDGYALDSSLSSCTNNATMSLDNGEIFVNTTNKTVCNAYLVNAYYWDNGSGFSFPNMPSTVNNTLDEEKSEVGFSDSPVYIRTTTEHEACLYYNNHEFCLGANYWDTNGTTTQTKIKTAMEKAFMTTTNDCNIYNSGSSVRCNFGGFGCSADSNGLVGCGVESSHLGCIVQSSGLAGCRVSW